MLRNRALRHVMALSVVLSTMSGPATAAERARVPYTDLPWTKEIFVPMRDGVNLSTDYALPEKQKERVPTVLVRTPYDKEKLEWLAMGPWLEKFYKNGYAIVMQSERGRNFSEGEFSNYLQGASKDGYDTIDWIVKQPWSNGKVGTIGCSSSGEQQLPMAASNHPGHAAMLPLAAGTAVGDVPGNGTRGAIYRGGVPTSGLWAWWYHDMATTERLLLPPNSTQEQRLRLRKGFSLQPDTYFYHIDSTRLLEHKNDIAPALMKLPSQNILRNLGGPLTPFDKYLTWGPGDSRWDDVEMIGAGDKTRVPGLHIQTWHDIGVGETTRLFKYLQDQNAPNQHLIVGPGPHCAMSDETRLANLSFGDLEIGDARYAGKDDGYVDLFMKWYDHWLKGGADQLANLPKVQLFVMGKGWVSGDRYPLPQTKMTNYYLASENSGGLSLAPPKTASVSEYVYDPAVPTPSNGGGCCGEAMALDQRPVEMRRDVLVFSTPVLSAPVTIAGPVEVVLYVGSSAKDTDFMVKLVDVYPDGKAINLSDDAFRARYREGFNKSVMMKSGEVYKITLSNMVTAVRFPPGHRIRLEVASSNFPIFERNLNTGGNNFDETSWVVATNSIHHGPQYPSHLVLPVLPD